MVDQALDVRAVSRCSRPEWRNLLSGPSTHGMSTAAHSALQGSHILWSTNESSHGQYNKARVLSCLGERWKLPVRDTGYWSHSDDEGISIILELG